MVTDELYDAVDTRFEGDGDLSSCRGVVPLFSHVSGGPVLRTEFCDRPIVFGRPPWRTVPKSQRSSGSPLSGL